MSSTSALNLRSTVFIAIALLLAGMLAFAILNQSVEPPVDVTIMEASPTAAADQSLANSLATSQAPTLLNGVFEDSSFFSADLISHIKSKPGLVGIAGGMCALVVAGMVFIYPIYREPVTYAGMIGRHFQEKLMMYAGMGSIATVVIAATAYHRHKAMQPNALKKASGFFSTAKDFPYKLGLNAPLCSDRHGSEAAAIDEAAHPESLQQEISREKTSKSAGGVKEFSSIIGMIPNVTKSTTHLFEPGTPCDGTTQGHEIHPRKIPEEKALGYREMVKAFLSKIRPDSNTTASTAQASGSTSEMFGKDVRHETPEQNIGKDNVSGPFRVVEEFLSMISPDFGGQAVQKHEAFQKEIRKGEASQSSNETAQESADLEPKTSSHLASLNSDTCDGNMSMMLETPSSGSATGSTTPTDGISVTDEPLLSGSTGKKTGNITLNDTSGGKSIEIDTTNATVAVSSVSEFVSYLSSTLGPLVENAHSLFFDGLVPNAYAMVRFLVSNFWFIVDGTEQYLNFCYHVVSKLHATHTASVFEILGVIPLFAVPVIIIVWIIWKRLSRKTIYQLAGRLLKILKFIQNELDKMTRQLAKFNEQRSALQQYHKQLADRIGEFNQDSNTEFEKERESLKREFNELEAQIPGQSGEPDLTNTALDSLKDHIEESKEQWRRLEDNLKEFQKRQKDAPKKQKRLNNELHKNSKKQDAIKEKLDRLDIETEHFAKPKQDDGAQSDESGEEVGKHAKSTCLKRRLLSYKLIQLQENHHKRAKALARLNKEQCEFPVQIELFEKLLEKFKRQRSKFTGKCGQLLNERQKYLNKLKKLMSQPLNPDLHDERYECVVQLAMLQKLLLGQIQEQNKLLAQENRSLIDLHNLLKKLDEVLAKGDTDLKEFGNDIKGMEQLLAGFKKSFCKGKELFNELKKPDSTTLERNKIIEKLQKYCKQLETQKQESKEVSSEKESSKCIRKLMKQIEKLGRFLSQESNLNKCLTDLDKFGARILFNPRRLNSLEDKYDQMQWLLQSLDEHWCEVDAFFKQLKQKEYVFEIESQHRPQENKDI